MMRISRFSLYVLSCFGVAVLTTAFIVQGQTSKPSSMPTSQPTTDRSLTFDIHNGYFVSNKFEPAAAESFVVIRSQDEFDKVFGVAMVMGDKSHRLPANAFQNNIVLAVVKRGKAMWNFKVDGITARNGVLTVRYSAAPTPGDSAEFACPLIISIDKGDYSMVEFVENQKLTGKVAATPSSGPASLDKQD